ncbi:hypothetical protein [Nonomuraea sp. JJY05]|uniref:hypothetical protein n=1 Tax=Nonomuraea sp. JJY05 TaxID=3350255 RepID=UPI00373FC58E
MCEGLYGVGQALVVDMLSLVAEDNEVGTALKRDPGAVGLDSLLTLRPTRRNQI